MKVISRDGNKVNKANNFLIGEKSALKADKQQGSHMGEPPSRHTGLAHRRVIPDLMLFCHHLEILINLE